MIQRIQSLLLAGVVILLTINLFVPIWRSTKETPALLTAFNIIYPHKDYNKPGINHFNFSGTSDEMADFLRAPFQTKPVYYIAGLIIICIGLTLFIIFQYKNRSLQIRLCSLLTLLVLGIIGTYFIAIPTAKKLLAVPPPDGGNYEIGYFLPIISSLLVMIARYYIRKDDALVKSVDRLR
jgi:hypothetical protein